MRSKKFRSTLITFGIVIAAFIACQVMISTGAMTRSLKGQLVPICAYVVMAVSLNLTVGISGELSLGHAGFMSVGAFSGIVMAMWLSKGMGVANETLCLLLAILTGGAAAGIAGVVIGIPVLRLRGDYLAIVTLAFGEIIRNVINCLYISLDGQRLHIAFNNPNVAGKLLVNGPAGATGVNKMATFGMGFALTLFTLFVVLNLIDSRSGRAIMAIRDNRIAAEAMGLNVTKYKMMAFVTSAVLAGMAGFCLALYHSLTAVRPVDPADYPGAAPEGFRWEAAVSREDGRAVFTGWACVEGEPFPDVDIRVVLYHAEDGAYYSIPTQMTPDEAATAAVADGRGYALGGFTAVVPEKVLAHPLAEYEICIAYRVGGFDFLASTGKTAEVKG